MASFAHAAFGAYLGRVHGGSTAARRVRAVALFTFFALLPDLDIIGLALGAVDGGPLGHRGFTHSLLFAVAMAAGAALVARGARARTAALVFAALASHGVLDAMTYDGGGVPLLWPFSDARFIAPWAPFAAAPKGMSFLSWYGGAVAFVEAACVLPLLAYVLLPDRWRPGSARARAALAMTCVVAAVGLTAALARSAPAIAFLDFARPDTVAMVR